MIPTLQIGALGRVRKAASAPGVVVTLDPTQKAADLTLSSGNLVLTRDATNDLAWRTCLATLGRNSGKYVFAASNVSNTLNGFMSGLAPPGFTLTQFPGFTATSYGLHSPNGRPYNNNAAVGVDIGAMGGGVSNHWAVDFGAGKIWVGRSGTWSGDPAAGTGERFTFTPGSTLIPAIACYQKTQVVQARFSPGDYPYTVPSGFSVWGG